MVTPVARTNKEAGPGTGPYFEGLVKDEIKAHFTPAGNQCTTRRGLVTKTKRYAFYDQSATIECECGTVVTQSS